MYHVLKEFLYIFRMDDALDIHPDEQELSELPSSLTSSVPVFNPVGMYCLVPQCSSTVKNYRHSDL